MQLNFTVTWEEGCVRETRKSVLYSIENFHICCGTYNQVIDVDYTVFVSLFFPSNK